MPALSLVPNPPILRIAELAYAEQLLVWAARKLELGIGCPGAIAAEFERAWNGREGAWEAFEALHGLVQLLVRSGRRRFHLHPPGYPALTHDERALLALVAACQGGHDAHAGALLRWLFPVGARAAAGAYAYRLAQALSRGGRHCHPRRAPRPPQGAGHPPLACAK